MTSHTWRLFLAFGLAAAVVYFLLPNDARTRALLDHLDKLGVATTNTSGFPLVELVLADADDLDAVGPAPDSTAAST